MKSDVIKTSRLRKARIKYFESDKNGCEVFCPEAYALLLKVGDAYINVVNPYEECNVYDRVPYSNSTKSGEDYGTKLLLVCGREEDGLCYVLEPKLGAFEDKSYIRFCDIENEIAYNLSVFYFDRWDLFKDSNRGYFDQFIQKGLAFKKDAEKREEFLNYISSKEEERKENKQKKLNI